jgi:hypothetical protein
VLFAQQAAIATLQSQLIQILEGGAIFGGARFTKSGDSIVDNGADKTGFKVGADGQLIASNGIINNLTITGDSLFEGDIKSGPLELTKSKSTPDTIIYSINTNADTIFDMESTRLGTKNISASINGTYMGKNVVRLNASESLDAHGKPFASVALYFDDGNVNYFLGTILLKNELRFNYLTGDRIFKLIGLLNQPSGPNIIWRKDDGTLMIGLEI